ncbi:MAG: sigma-54-dependent Fis family transcriptional regulator [Nitrospirae bacterium]|nr:sigma-54-dependent Fis family transcriptional regulator [Nitrospirota bacterium]
MRSKGKVFLLDDDKLITSMLSRALNSEGYEVSAETTADDIINKIQNLSPDIVMLDINLPEKSGIDILQEIKGMGTNTQVIMLTADDTAETAVRAMKLGAADYLTKPFNIEEVKIIINNTIEKTRLKQEVDFLRKVNCESFEKDIIGESIIIKGLKSKIDKITDAHVSTILITGESGTGKELIARHIHYSLHSLCFSHYAPFIGINCAALPELLLESELFGYEKGAFTDAKSDKKGLFELAGEGTLLLDEIGEMKMSLQSKLLRVIEERTIRRIGGKEEIPVNATVISTTNRNLSEAVERGEFRMDLFYRLNTFSLHIPPLRDRKEDIPILARYFLSYFSTRYNKKTIKGFSSETEQCMLTYNWPGNIRELKNVIERIVVLENTEMILPEHLPKEFTTLALTAKTELKDSFILPETGINLDELEKNLILQALKKARNNKTIAAKLLNVSYDSLRYQIKKFGLE